MSGRIVVGVDGTSASVAALRWAVNRASDRDAVLVLARVIDDDRGDDAGRERSVRAELAATRASVRESFPALTVESVVRTGNPTIELVRVAEGVDLLVVGTHKTGFVQGRVFGSRGIRLAGSASVPLAVVPEFATGQRAGIVVGVDDSAAGREAIRFAGDEARRGGDDLLMILGGAGSVNPHELELTATALRIAEEAGADVGVRIRVLRRPAAKALIEVAQTARLLVIGSSRHHVDGDTALGPVAYDVLFNISTPTIVVHPRVTASTAAARPLRVP
jgi:nucleotide-binding universal stress UspA family protein